MLNGSLGRQDSVREFLLKGVIGLLAVMLITFVQYFG